MFNLIAFNNVLAELDTNPFDAYTPEQASWVTGFIVVGFFLWATNNEIIQAVGIILMVLAGFVAC